MEGLMAVRSDIKTKYADTRCVDIDAQGTYALFRLKMEIYVHVG